MSEVINRAIAPSSEEIKNIKIVEGQRVRLANGIGLHYINAGTSDIIKLDLVCDGGVINQHKNTVAAATSSMLREGTKSKTSEQIADELDFYGAYFQTQCYADDSTITLYCLKKHFSSCLPYIIDIINESIFPESELNTYKKNSIQKLMVNKERNSFLLRRLFYSSVFGETSPYGTFSEPDDYNTLSRENILDFYSLNYKNGLKYILISGAIDESVIKTSEGLLGGFKPYNKEKKNVLSSGKTGDNVFLEKKNSVQSAIRIGRKLVNRIHPDFRKLQILNLVLGGYFGSRLMKNLREEKGLTYGIYSVVESYINDGCFYIETEINNDLRDSGVKEIYLEIDRLKNELIGEEELSLAKNYLLGSFLRSIDGPFSLADKQKILIDYGLEYSYYYDYLNTIKTINANELLELANKYFKKEDLSEIIVGGK